MIKVYDQDSAMLAVLDYADAIGYTLPHNDLWTATFRLPAADPKKAFCQMHNLVSIYDGPRNIGLYRIISTPSDDVTDLAGYTVYNCEHVAATLLDDILFGYHEIGGGSIRTADVIRYILAQQETPRWQLGVCDFTNRFTYKFENVTLLSALLSLGEVLTEPYTWDFDTTTTPWTVNLRKADTAAGCGIYYARNLQKITKTVDASTLVTRLYLLGYGEGVNQLTIKDINNGLPYLDADTISVYGIKKSVFCDRRFENAESLMARGRALLESLKIPYTTYTAKAADLVQLTGDSWDEFMPGKVVHVMDGEDGVEFEARLVTVAKTNASARSGDLELTIANSVRDIADSINTLADRQGINELYSQGATNLYSQQYADNADAEHPARMKVYIPSGCVRINQMLLSYDVEPFRAYETGAASGGGTTVTSTDGGGTTVTSTDGGGTTVTSAGGGGMTYTSEAGGGSTVTSAGGGGMTYTSEAGGGITVTSEAGGGMTYTSEAGGAITVTSTSGGGTTVTSTDGGGSETTSSAGGSETITEEQKIVSTTAATGGPIAGHSGDTSGNTGGASSSSTGGSGSLTTGTSSLLTTDSGGGSISTSSAGSHTHSGPSHSHGMGHYHSGPSHTHDIDGHTHSGPSHTHTGGAHTHSFSDSYTLGWGHTHSITSGAANTGGVNSYSSKTISISGDTGSAGATKTSAAGTGDTGSTALTTNAAGTGKTGNAITSGGDSRIYTTEDGTGDTSSAGGHTHTMGNHTHGMSHTHSVSSHTHDMTHTHNFSHMHNVAVSITIPGITINIPSHNHSVSISAHSHDVTIDDHSHDVTIDDHSHDVIIDDHSHDVIIDPHSHDVTIDDHTHDVTIDPHSHDVTIDDHTHDVTISDHSHGVTIDDHSHDVTIEPHTHDIVHGIFEGETASEISIIVDGVAVPGFSAPAVDELDIVQWLEKDAEGKITRGTWHTIELVPNRMTRIEANLFVQTFVQSVGGGNY